MLAVLLVLAPPPLLQFPPGSDWHLPPGVTTFSTDAGAVRVRSMTVPAGASLRVYGAKPFEVIAEETIRIEGVVDASGYDSTILFSLFVPDQGHHGAIGGPGGGRGGRGYPGGQEIVDGGAQGSFIRFPEHHVLRLGGRGGETGYSPVLPPLLRRGGGGGGGAFGPDDPARGPGLAARAGAPGHPLALVW